MTFFYKYDKRFPFFILRIVDNIIIVITIIIKTLSNAHIYKKKIIGKNSCMSHQIILERFSTL